jgi:hypothetical protein
MLLSGPWFALGVGDMKRVNTFAFYYLGMKLAGAAEIKDGVPLNVDSFVSLIGARDAMRSFLDESVVQVRTCRAAAQAVLDAIGPVVEKTRNSPVTQGGEALAPLSWAPLSWGEAYAIRTSIGNFATVLGAELPTLDTYTVSQKAAYSTPDLIDHAELLLPEAVRMKLAPEAIKDMREAGRCLAFSTPTAAAFHIMRATESMIVSYFAKVVGKRPKKAMRNWGLYIKMLETHGADPKVTGFLRHLKDQYRNPVSHPEEFLSVDQALTLVSAAVAAICAMAEAIS